MFTECLKMNFKACNIIPKVKWVQNYLQNNIYSIESIYYIIANDLPESFYWNVILILIMIPAKH